jgi:hypothetical protein
LDDGWSRGNSPYSPDLVMRPMSCAYSLNHMAPYGPAVISARRFPLGGAGNSVTAPAVLTRAMRPLTSVYQRFPSGPAATQIGLEDNGNQLKTPAVVKRPASGA